MSTLILRERFPGRGGFTLVELLVVGVADHAPNDSHHHFDDFTSNHPTGVNFLLGDASVRRFDDSIEVEVYKALCTRAGGESASVSD